MNNLKKIGLSALAGSLVATSAFAGEMSVSGSAKATYTDRGETTNTGNNFGMNKLLSFTGSGDLDTGHSISVYFGNNGTSQSSASMTYDMGDMGSLTLDNGVGGHGIGSIDDKHQQLLKKSGTISIMVLVMMVSELESEMLVQ